MALQPDGPAPYTTAQAAIITLDGWRERGLGVPITPDVLVRAGVSESLGNRTLMSLKQLGLIDEDGRPSPQMEDLRLARGPDEYQARLQKWVQGVYADVLQYADPSVDASDRVAEAFRTYLPKGQRRGMAALLIGLWKYAGLPLPSESAPSTPRSTVMRPGRAPTTVRSLRLPLSQGRSLEESAADDLPPGLVGLLRQIPRDGASWTAEKREGFLNAFTAVLDYSVPIGDPDPSHPIDDEDDSSEVQ
jgi:Family of unknown function (DUF5343)